MQVDATRGAGITETLTVTQPAAATMLEYIPWLLELFEEPVRVEAGSIITPTTPGASTTMRADSLARRRVA